MREFKVKVGQERDPADLNYFRPTEVDLLIGDPTKAKENLDGFRSTTWIR